MKRYRDDDAGSTQMLEVVVIASIMISAATFVATYESPPIGTGATRDNLEQQASDALAILYDTKVLGSNFGDNALSVYLAECMQGNCSKMTTRLDRLLPTGASYAIYVSNGVTTYPVYVGREPAGEAVTTTRLLEPRWSNSFVATGTNTVDTNSESLTVYTLPIFNSNAITQGGSPLSVYVHGTRVKDGSDYTLTAHHSTRAYDSSDASKASAVSFTFVDAQNVSLPFSDVRATTMSGGVPSLDPLDLRVRLTESANVPVPVDTNITIVVPRGWLASANATQNPDWTILANATDAGGNATGGEVRAKLTRAISNESVEFKFDAIYLGDRLDDYPFQAFLSRGALSVATTVLRAETHAAGSSYQTPSIYMSVPRPMGATATTTWTLAGIVPEQPSLLKALDNVLTIDRIEIIEQDGAAIFGGVAGISSMGGTWQNLGDRLVWTGLHTFTHSAPLNMTFNVTASGTAGAKGTQTPFFPPVTFDAGTGRLTTQTSPGLYRNTFLPSNADKGYTGYSNSSSPTLKNNTARSDAVYRSTLLPGSTSYYTGVDNILQDSIYGSYVSVERRTTPVGGTVVMTADVQSLLFALAESGQSAGISVNFYPPWTGDEHTPIWSQPNLDSGLLSSNVNNMVLLDLNADGYPDPIVGTDNGRVFGLHALTGARFQGNVYSAPLRSTEDTASTASILQMGLVSWDNTTYIVLGTDGASTGLIILDTSFNVFKTFDLAGRDVISLDTSRDITGDGRTDILVATAAGTTSAVYVLQSLAGQSGLTPLTPTTPIPDYADAFYESPGAAAALLSLPRSGSPDERPGLAVTIQTVVGVDPNVQIDAYTPGQSQFRPTIGLPRVGLQGLDNTGAATYTYFGSPVTKALPFDYDGNAAIDILTGGPAGYVALLNGTVATQPIYSTVMTGLQKFIASDTPTPFESYLISDDGSIIYTDDGWTSIFCANCEPVTQADIKIPTAKAIASNGTASIWLAGTANTLQRSVTQDTAWVPNAPNVKPILMYPEAPAGVRWSIILDSQQAYSFAESIHDFTDIHFGRGADADKGWVIGTKCLGLALVCDQSLIMRTENGGQSWILASNSDPVNKVESANDGIVDSLLRRLVSVDENRMWIVGDNGTILRSSDGGISWKGIASPTTANFYDMQCLASAGTHCYVVGSNGTAYLLTRSDDADHQVQDDEGFTWSVLPVGSFAPGKLLRSVGFMNTTEGYIGTDNMVLKTYDGGQHWTTLPLNYLENSGYKVDVFPSGIGYVYGGGQTNARTWFLADYPLESKARTISLTPEIPSDSHIVQVTLLRSNVSISEGSGSASVYATSDGTDWTPMGSLASAQGGGRNRTLLPAYFDPENAGSNLQIEVVLQTPGDKTLTTPLIRTLDFVVTYLLDNVPYEVVVPLDFTNQNQVDQSNTTAWWNTEVGALHQSLVREYWVRNVSGEVRDIQTGYNVSGGARDEVWVGTGGIIALNSPDYVIYAGTDKSKFVQPDNRVYLLDGDNGTILAKTAPFDGNVTHLRLADSGNDGVPDYVYASTWNPTNGTSTLYALDPLTLDILWTTAMNGQVNRIAAGLTYNNEPSVFTATQAGTAANSGPGLVWAINATDASPAWKSIPDDRGRYVVSKDIPANWWFGPYVVEVEVTWEDATEYNLTAPLLRTARVYDYFVVTPPDSLSPPSPIYDVHLVTWFDDWR